MGKRKKYYSKKRALEQSLTSQRRHRLKNIDETFTFHRALSCFALLLFVAVFYYVFYSDFFKIKKIVLIDNKQVAEEEIKFVAEESYGKRRFLIFPGDNIIVFSISSLQDKIVKQVPEVKDVEIEKKYPDVLKIIVKEKIPTAIWSIDGQEFYIDQEGSIAYAFNKDESIDNLPRVVDLSGTKIGINEKATSQETMNFIRSASEYFPQKIGEGIDKYFLPSGAAEEIHLKSDKGYLVYFSLKRGAKEQIEDLLTIKESQLQDVEIDYIDMRVENWVYYK